ncbi:hypothetical protein WDU94_011627 [Cyamophila willieti]
MVFLSSMPLLATLAISYMFSTVSSNALPEPTANATATQEHPELLPPKAFELCNLTKTAVCPRGQPETEPLCQEYGKIVGGTEPLCDGDNACAFFLNLTNGVEKAVYVSLNNNRSTATIYTKCKNKLVIYSMYNNRWPTK